jgi:alpha,alpha-trehalase
MKKIILAALFCLPLATIAQQKKYPPAPDKIYGQLFKDIQMQQIFPSGKTFVDCIPKRKTADIMYDYGMMKGPGMDLKKFVENNFNLPPAPPQLNYIQQEKDIEKHMQNLLGVLKRDADVSPRWEGKEANGLSLLGLPYPYVVPGGQYNEAHYWDSYFMMQGLKVSGDTGLLENIVKNFDYLIFSFGHIPAGSRTYYIGRSQPPFFCMMVEMLATLKGNSIYKKYLPSMLKEYAYWMEGADSIKEGEAVKHLVKLQDGTILNRYWDENEIPRQENYKADYETADTAVQALAMVIRVASEEQLKDILNKRRIEAYRDIRAADESGWGFSSRWLTDVSRKSSIQTTKIIPVDLNCLLYNMENIIAKALRLSRNNKVAMQYVQKATRRKRAILKYCWSTEKAFFVDYNFQTNQPSEAITAAGLFPLFVKIATPVQAQAVAKKVTSLLLKEGGMINSINNTGTEWDAPYGCAPLHWIAVTAFRNYNNNKIAKTIAVRWLTLVKKVYDNTGHVLNKYNVEDIQKM